MEGPDRHCLASGRVSEGDLTIIGESPIMMPWKRKRGCLPDKSKPFGKAPAFPRWLSGSWST